MDAGGAFGNWGRPSGYTQGFLDNWNQKKTTLTKLKLYEMDFEVDYHESDKEKMLRLQYETMQQQIDNTYFMPKTLYKKN